MSLTQILEELPLLSEGERQQVHAKLAELEGWPPPADDSPEMIAFVEAGIRSADTEPLVSAEEVRRQLREWISR